jgi:positive regulator of sigma E activity
MQAKRAILPAMLLAFVLGTGALLVWFVGAMWITTTVEQLLARSQPYVSLVITRQGEPLLSWVEYDPPSRIQHYRTLDGREPTSFNGIDYARYAALPRAPDKPELLAWNQRLAAFASGTSDRREAWYLVEEGTGQGGHAYFVGYDDRTKSRIGYLSRGGFRLDLPPTEEQYIVDRPLGYHSGGYATAQSSETSVNSSVTLVNAENETLIYLIDESGLFVVSLDKRSVAKVTLPGQPLSVAHLPVPVTVKSEAQAGQEERTIEVNEDRVLVLLSERIEMLDRQNRTLLSTPVPEAARDRNIQYHLCEGNRVVLQVAQTLERRKPDLFWYDAAGKLERQQQVELPPYWNEHLGAMAWVLALVYPTPSLFGLLAYFVPRKYSAAELAPAALLLLVFSLVSAWVVYRHARRYADPAAAIWALFALVFGLPALVGYWLHRIWPHRQRCANCSAMVPRDRLACAVCATDFRPPVLQGTEVFA